jgi:mono/diheme cytochrome c family protein
MHGRRLFFGLVLAAFTAAAATPGKLDFDRDIRPILSDNCFACHGPDEAQRKAKLRLDTPEGAFEDRKAYKIIVPGDSASSRLYQRISAEKPASRMPPPYAQRQLTPAQIDLIKRWIDGGAKYEIHWAWVAPQRPDTPQTKNTKWARNEIDRFVLRRLEQENLTPSPEADKATLIRRVSLDLTGLPPTPAEVDRFLADKTPNAYEKVVDRLLASPHYGERMAVDWLDLARYSDTHGYHIDSHRDMWRWREWVINAFNRNMPYDEFAVEQIAGDLLPNSTTEQKIATGFNRNHMINFEGGAIPEEYQVEYAIDRSTTAATTFLGITMGCARCHDHKYDPIRQKDFYSFYAFFNTIPEKGLDGKDGNAEPMLQLIPDGLRPELDSIDTRLKELKPEFEPNRIAPLVADWQKTALDRLPEAPRAGLLAHYEFDGNLSDASGNYRTARVVTGTPAFGGGAVGRAIDFKGDSIVTLAHGVALDGPFSMAFWIRPEGKKEGEISIFRKGGLELAMDEFEVIPERRYGTHFIVRFNGIEVRTVKRVATDEWIHLGLNYDGAGKASGLQLFVDANPAELSVVSDRFLATPGSVAPVEIGAASKGYKGGIDDFRIYGRVLKPEEIDELAHHESIKQLLALPLSKSDKDDHERIAAYFLTYAALRQLQSDYAEYIRLKARKHDFDLAIPTVMVMREAEKPRESFVLGRGMYDNPKEKVTPNVPSFLPPLPPSLPKDAPPNRLTLARWLVDPKNPLTARVAVNRIWQTLFGIGIVETAEDFGSQGDQPSHPQLLDWMATEFIRDKWDMKAMTRMIVTSATYRQSSRVTPELLEKDPRNRLLARGARFRLPAEFVRDNALAVSGLLEDKLGGPSVLPYQPSGLWEELAFGDVYSAQTYVQSHGPDLYRRSLYTFEKRTVAPASMNIFDAPDREKCTARRGRTNTPLQSLVLLNDPTFVEAARALAQRMLLEGGRDTGARINYGFRLATARRPEPKERQVFRDMAERELSIYRKDERSAEKLISVGESKPDAHIDKAELAAWTTVASMMLNMDETITRE